MNKRKTFTLSIITALVFSVLLSVSGFDASCSEIQREILRLHVVANSDQTEDQEIKLQVRDRILELESQLWKSADSKEEAMNIVNNHLEEIEREAVDMVKDAGYSAKAELTNCYFPTRVYENFTLPAGYYDALKITLGSGEGKNWWCVLFPEICLGAVGDFDGVLSDNSKKIVTEPENYRVKFKVVELYQDIRQKINSIF